jgi:hypothetical protein
MTDAGKPFSAPEPRGQNDRQVILLTDSSGLIRDGPLTCSLPPLPRRHRLELIMQKIDFGPSKISSNKRCYSWRTILRRELCTWMPPL